MDPLGSIDDHLRALPLSVRFANVAVVVPACAILSMVLIGLGIAVAKARDDQKHWSERARNLWPARTTSLLLTFVLPFWFAVIATIGYSGPLAATPGPVFFLLVFVASLAGAFGVQWRLERTTPVGKASLWAHARAAIAAAVFLYSHYTAAAIGAWVCFAFNVRWYVAVPAALVAIPAFSTYAALPLSRTFGFVHSASPKLEQVVREAVAPFGTPLPKLWVIESMTCNAFALPLARAIVWTAPAINVLRDDEIAAATLHEVAHLDEQHAAMRRRVVSALALAVGIATLPSLAVDFGPLPAVAVITVFLYLRARTLASSKELEAHADSHAHSQDVHRVAFARALERVYETGLIPCVTPYGATHPHLYDRMLAAGVTPSYPRPKEPSRLRAMLGLLVGFGGAALITFVATIALLLQSFWAPTNGKEGIALASLSGGALSSLIREGEIRFRDRVLKTAGALYAACVRMQEPSCQRMQHSPGRSRHRNRPMRRSRGTYEERGNEGSPSALLRGDAWTS